VPRVRSDCLYWHPCAAEHEDGSVSPQAISVHLRKTRLPFLDLRLDGPQSAKRDHARTATQPTTTRFQRPDRNQLAQIPVGRTR